MTRTGWLSGAGVLAAVAVVMAASWLAGDRASAQVRGRGEVVDLRPQPTRMQIEVIEVKAGPDEVAGLDVELLQEKGLSVESLIERTGKLGGARLVLRVDSIADLTRPLSWNRGQRVPVVQAVTVDAQGRTTPSVSYNEVGYILKLSGAWRGEEEPLFGDVSFSLEISDVADSAVISQDVSLPQFEKTSINQCFLLRSGEPIVLAGNAIAADPPEQGGQTSLLLVRMTATRLNM